jgi:hypothetical protein
VGNLTIWDLLLSPFYLIILIALAKRFRDRHYPVGHPLREYYLKGLYAKFGGAIFIALLYEFYYPGGDTYNFFTQSKIINSAFSDSFSIWFKLMLHSPADADPKLYSYISQLWWYNDTSSYTISRIGAVLGLLNGTSYIPIALLFAFLSYSGIWAMYVTFVKIYPTLYKHLALAFLFIPSTFIWGSAMFKDTVCMFGLGWMTYTTFRLFVDRDFSFKNIILLSISFYLIAIIKIYILLAFLPAISIWVMLTYSKKIPSVALRWLVNLGFILFSVSLFTYFGQRFAKDLDEYSLDNIAKKSQKTSGWITYVSNLQEGSAYDIGTYEPSIQGMLSKFPQAVNVTLFRPYIWEAKKPIVLLSSFESLAFLGFVLFIFYKNGIGYVFKRIFSDPNLSFFFIFTLIFAFAVGLSTGNFGSLSRYKIPCIPFFGALLLIIHYSNKKRINEQATQRASQKRKVHRIA